MKLKQGFKRFMSSFLAVVMAFSLMPTTVFGATSENAKASGSTTKQYPSYLTLNATNYSKSGSTLYHSTQPSIGTAYFHRFRMTGSDGVLYNGFCTDHTKRMSSNLKGTWKPNGTVYGPYDPYGDASHRWAALPWLDYYEFHYQKEGATWSDWTYKWVNAWVQASVWLAVAGEITNVYYSDFNTAEQNAAAMKDIDKLVNERIQALKYCGATDTYEQSAAWLKYTPYGVFKNENYTVNGYKYGNLQWVEYDYYGTNGKKDASVQPILIPVKAAEVKENPVYFTLRKTDTADPTKDLSAAFGVYADEACTKFLENYTASPGNYTFSVNLPDGQSKITVYLKEAQAPSGYMKSSNVYRVTLTTDNARVDRAKPVNEVNDGTGWKPMDTVGVATNDSSANADSYVIFNWNIPGTKSIRSNGMHDKSIGEGALYFETSDNTNLNTNGIPNMELLERCQGSVDGVGTPTVGDNYVQWTLKNGTIKFVWQGWYTEPSGGTRVTESMTYPTYGDDHSQDTASEPVTYYGHWRVETNIKDEGQPGQGTASVDGNFFTVYWDYQSNIGKGGGATACLVGKVTIRVLTAISSGGESPVNPTFKDYTIEAAFSVPDDPANVGYKFKGWCLGDVTGKGTLYQSSDAQVMAGLVSAGSTFFAIWEPEKINVSYDANGGTGAPGSQTFTYDKAGKLSEQQPTRTGYDFMGWSYTPTTSDYGVVFSAGDSLSAETVDGMYTMGQNVTLYAVWAPQRVIITWTNTQYSKDFSQSTEYKYGDKLTYIGDLTNTEGYDFTGWLSDGGVQAADGMDLDESILTYVPNADEGAGAGHGGYWAITFKGQWEKKTNSYTAYILWLDDTDNDGVRPKTVDLFLTENSTDTMVDETKVSVTNQHRIAAGETITINGKNYVSDGNNVWSYTWKDLPITWEDTTTNYVYSLYVAGEDSQYGDYSYGIDNVTSRWCGTVVMTHKLITRNVDVQAVWDDQSDNDKLRPDSITFSLYARDSANSGFKKLTDTKYTIALSGSGNVWNYTFTDLPRFKDGYEIQYSIRPNEANVETAAGDLNQYTVDYKTDAIMYLKHENITQDVTGTVIWNDDSNRDGHRPDSIKIQLYKDGVPYLLNGEAVYATLTKNGNNTWTYTFNGVEQMADGNMSHYSIRVVDINDINATIATNDGVENAYRADYSAMTVVLSHEICRSDVVSRVNWNDNSDQDGIRPDSIKVELYANGEKVPGDDYTVTISEAGNVWVHTFGDMPEYTKGEEGKEIVYTIKVLEVNKDELYGRYILTGNQLNQNKVKYTASYEAKEPIATLTHELDTTTVTLAIEWGDNNNNDNSRPDRVLVSLYKSIDGTNWTLVNDNYVLTARNGWNHTVDSLPKYSDGGREVQYKIALNPGQTFVQENGGTYAASSTGTLLRLVRDASLTYVTARVDWQDSDNQDQLRPGSLGLQLFAKYGNAEPVLVDNSMMVVSADTDWKATWTALPLMKNGSYVEYSVRVVEIPDGYEPLYGAEESDPTSPAPNNRLLVQMIHDQKLENYTVNVVWNDNSNNGGKRPSELPIALYANGVLVTGTNVKLTTDNAVEGNTDTWSYTFENLPVNAAGKPIDYTVKIYGAYSNSNLYSELTAGLTLYMSMEPIQQNLNLKFFFEDNNNADGSRPTRIKLTLLANGEVVTNDDQEPITITNPNAETTDAFYNLPVYSTGTTKISYGVLVEMVTGGDGYSYTVYGNGEDNTTATLSGNRPGNLDITFSKSRDVGTQSGAIYWYDTNNQWNNRPETLTLYLWNDKTTSRIGTYTLNVTENAGIIIRDESGKEIGRGEGSKTSDVWTYTLTNLPMKANGENITYRITVAGSSLDNFYPTRVDNIDMNASLTMKGFDPTITRDFRADVTWVDNENAWNTRENVVVTLLANGVQYKTVSLTAQNVSSTDPNVWTYTWEKVPTYIDGVAVVWTAEITDLSRYTESVIIDDDGASFKMVQCFGVDFTVNWNDKSNDDGVRPDALELDVFGQGNDPVATVTFTGDPDAAKWTSSVEDLPVWKSGVNTSEQAVYTFAWKGAGDNSGTYADLISNFYSSAAHLEGNDEYDKDGTFYHFTGVSANSDYENAGIYKWETVLTHDKSQWEEIPCTIVWDDDGDRDGLRPESVKVQLLANGVAVGEPVEVTGDMDAPSWHISWTDLDKFVNLGTNVTYTIDLVDDVSEYTASVSGVAPLMTTLTMSHELITYNVFATIVWDDDSQMVGNITRTDVDVQFYCNGEAVGEPIVVTKPGDSTKSVKVTLDPQYVYSNHGKMNKYTVELLDAAGSDPTLSDLVAGGYTVNYDFNNELEPVVTIRHDYYDVSGYVHFRYNTSDDYLVEGAVVTVYLVKDGVYSAVGSATTDAQGHYYITGIPSGDLEIRAIYNYQDHRIAGKTTRTLDRIDLVKDEDGRGQRVDVLLTYDAAIDDGLYKHNASGRVLYEQATVNADGQTVSTNRTPAANANVLVYKVNAATGKAEYVTLTTTNENGEYTLKGLEDGTYQLTVYCTYEDAPYTYDNTNAVADGLSFPLSFNDAQWADIIVKLPSKSNVGPIIPKPEPEPEPVPEPCVVDGKVFYEVNGVHTEDPVSGVDVFVYDNASQMLVGTATTDAAGSFKMEGIQAGDYTAVYSYAGHASRVQVFTVTETAYNAGTFTVNPVYFAKNDNTGLAEISGTILDDAGNPYDVLVYVYKKNADGSKGDLSGCAYTDEYGHYSFAVAAGSTYLVEYRKIDTVVTTEVITYPGTGASNVNLDYYTISGVVTDNSGNPVSGAVVNLYYQENIVKNFLTGADGKYSITNIVPDKTGKYSLEIFFADGHSERHNMTLGYDAPVVTKNGNKYVIEGVADAGTTATLRKNDNGIISTVTTAAVSSDGKFQFTNLSDGDYEILIAKGQRGETVYMTVPAEQMTWSYTETISGDVTDSIGRVRTANVTLLDKDGKPIGETQVTLADGHYSFTAPNGTYSIRIAYPTAGSVLANRSTTDKDSFGNAYPNGMTVGSEWVYNLNAQGASGTVKDQNGRAIANAQVVLTSKTIRTPEGTLKTYTATADNNGEWYIGVPAGDYTVRAMVIVDSTHSYFSNENPDLTVALNTPVTNLTITRYDLSGSVVRSGDNTKLTNADVTVTNESGTVVFVGTTDDNGSFAAVLVPGTYTVSASYMGQTGNKTITVNADAQVTVEVSLPYTLSGTVTNSDGSPARNAIVYYTDKNDVKSSVSVNDDGTYTLALGAGTYKVYASNGSTTSETKTVTLDTDKVVDFSLRIPESGYTMTGVVVDQQGNRLENAIVTVLHGEDKVIYQRLSTDSNGEFSISGVPDGEYYLSAQWTKTENGEAKSYVTYADLTVVVPSEQMKNIVLTVLYREPDPTPDPAVGLGDSKPQAGESAYTIDGTVKDPNGNIVVGATVVLYRYDRDANSWTRVSETTSNDDGYYAFTQLPPAIYRVDVSFGTSENVDAEMGGYVVSGYAVDEDGDPYVGARVNLYDEAGNLLYWDTTDNSGYYEFNELPSGHYKVEIIPADSYTENTTPDETVDNTYSISGACNEGDTVTLYGEDDNEMDSMVSNDGTYEFTDLPAANYKVVITPADSEQDKVIKVIALGDATVTVTRTGDTFTIEGTVYDENGDVITDGVRVEKTTLDGESLEYFNTQADGAYVFYDVTEGCYKLTFNYNGSTKVIYVDCTTDPVEENIFTIVISGTVLNDKGETVEGAKVDVIDDNDDVVDSMTTEADGEYKFTVRAGVDYTIRITYPNSNTYTQVISAIQNVPVVSEPTPGSFRIDGKVLDGDGNGIYQARVNLYKIDGTSLGYFKSAQDGSYNFRNLSEGSYYIEVEVNGSVTRTYIEATSHGPSASADGSYTISGVAKDSEGNPVKGALVEVKDVNGALVVSTVTSDNGVYNFTVNPGSYTVEITYPSSETIDTGNGDAKADTFTIYGFVIDENGNKISGVDVKLSVKNGDSWDDVSATVSDVGGYYEFVGLPAGTYQVHIGPYNETTKDYEITVPGGDVDKPDTKPEPDPKPEFPEDKITFKGIVQTNNGHVLKGAVVFIVDEDSSPYENEKTVVSTTSKQDGSWVYGNFDASHYTIYAQYTHKYGMNQSAEDYRNFHADADRDNLVLTITLAYTKDVNGDGIDETVYAGLDDTFDTADDYYIKNINGGDEKVYPGKDLVIGTKDDEWFTDVDGDGKEDTIYVGEDRIAGTEDDYYKADPDKDGVEEPVYANTDKTPGTNDDWWPHDVDKDGKDEVIHVGPDAKPGTEDDWYEWDINKDGVPETKVNVGPDGIPGTEDDTYVYPVDGENKLIHVGPDGIPGTEDDWYEKDMDGDGKDEKVNVGPDGIPGTDDDWWTYLLTFNGNGGSVNSEPVFNIDAARLSTLPTASRDNFTFNGWYTAAEGGYSVSLSALRNVRQNTTVYAHWTENKPTQDYVATFDANGGSVNGKSVDSVRISTLSKLPVPTRTNYTFDGWFTSANGGSEISLDTLKAATSNITIYAHWTKNTVVPADYDITFNANGGKVKGDSTYTTSSSDLRSLPTATRSGYTFDGWYSSANGGSLMTLAKLKDISGDTTVYARWTKVGGGTTGGNTGGGGIGGGGSTGGGGGGGGSVGGGSVTPTPTPTPTPVNPTGPVVLPGVSNMLITDEHMSYLVGYTDGSFGPNRNMTRGEAAMMFYRLLKNKNVDTTGISFKDVGKDLWCGEAIKVLAKVGIVAGYTDGRYGVNDPITRAQFATMAVRFLEGDYDISGVSAFKDVKTTDWYYHSVMVAAKCGWVGGYGNGYFGPNDLITRAQVTTLVNNMLGRQSDKDFVAKNAAALMHFTDVKSSDWYYQAVVEATNAHSFYKESGVETSWTSLKK